MDLKNIDKKGVFELIKNYKKEKKYEDGIKFLKDQLSFSNNPIYLFYIADFYYSLNDYASSDEYLSQFLKHKANDYWGNILRAKLLMKRKNYREALDILLPLSNAQNNKFTVLLHIGICYLKLKKIDDAIDYLKKSININPEPSGYAYYYLSTAYYEKKDLKNSIKYMEEAYNKTNSNFYYQRLIKFKIEAMPIKEREKEIQNILNISGKENNPELHILLGETLLKQKKYEEAVNSFYKAVLINHNNIFYKERYIYACDKAGKYEVVYDLARNIINKKPHQIWLQVLFTRASIKLKKIDEALEFYNNLVNRTKIKAIWKQINILQKA